MAERTNLKQIWDTHLFKEYLSANQGEPESLNFLRPYLSLDWKNLSRLHKKKALFATRELVHTSTRCYIHEGRGFRDLNRDMSDSIGKKVNQLPDIFHKHGQFNLYTFQTAQIISIVPGPQSSIQL